MKKTNWLIAVLLIVALTIASSPLCLNVSAQTKYRVWGYVLDSQGQGIKGAEINIQKAGIPDVYSNASGYYSTNVPVGTYQIYVWPPYDSHYIYYSEAHASVNFPLNKNFTLNTGCKVSGYVINSTGNPMINATVFFTTESNVLYASGFLTDQNGYYYANMPAGTYKIDAHPQSLTISAYENQCTPFPTYIETNFAVNSDITRNITVDIPPPTTSPTPNPTAPTPTASPTPSSSTTNPTSRPSATPKPIPKPIPTNNPTPAQTSITINTDAAHCKVNNTLNISGTLMDNNGNPLNHENISVSYNNPNNATWLLISIVQTDAEGQYTLNWQVPTSGTLQ
jgi:hypothetical protein